MEKFTHYTDNQLLIEIQKGDEAAFTTLYRRYYKSLCLKAYKRIPSTPLVEEIVQDVFVNLWLKASLLDTEGNLEAYLFATLRNKILFVLRTERNRNFYMSKIQSLLQSQKAGADSNLSHLRELQNQLDHTIAQLSPQCKEAFLLSRYEHLSYQEIANRMHISINTVEKHISKALRILRARLSEYKELLMLMIIIVDSMLIRVFYNF